MNHYKDWLIKIQTLGININQRKTVLNSQVQEINYYDISHENPYLHPDYNNELKELKELAITDLLNLPREQVLFHLQRIGNVKKVFSRFWERYYHAEIPNGDQKNLDLLLHLNLDELFISPRLMFFDHAIATDDFINDLKDSIRFREQILKDFEKGVSSAINVNKEGEFTSLPVAERKISKAVPVFKEDIIPELYSLLKDYFKPGEQKKLMSLLQSKDSIDGPLLFTGNGNQLADAFRQLFDANLVAGCNKTELQQWIFSHFLYREKGMEKHFTERYLQDMISSNTKSCQAPLFDIRRDDGRFYLHAVTRITKK